VAVLYAQHRQRWPVSDKNRQVITRNIYLPPAFAFTVPLALLPFTLGARPLVHAHRCLLCTRCIPHGVVS
jgi:hypothetical protein